MKHDRDNPEHNLSFSEYIFFDVQEPEDNFDTKNKINVLKYIPNEKCSICNKNIRLENNNKITHCNKCKGSLCDNCEQNHSSLFPGHEFIIRKYIVNKTPNNEYDNNINKNGKCNICQRNIPIITNGKIIYCYNCKGNICNSCGIIHTKKIQNTKHII